MGCVVRVGERRNSYSMYLENQKARYHLEKIGTNERAL